MPRAKYPRRSYADRSDFRTKALAVGLALLAGAVLAAWILSKHKGRLTSAVVPTRAVPAQYEWLEKQGLASLHFLFSTTCHTIHDFQPWQTQVLVYSHKNHRYPGRITELRGCNADGEWVVPQTTYEPYTVVRVPDMDELKALDPYAPRKRPHSLQYLLAHHPQLIGSDELIILLEPDQPLIAPLWPDLGVAPGKPAAATASIGRGFLDIAARKFCGGLDTCNRSVLEAAGHYDETLEIGSPYVIHPADVKPLADMWTQVMEEVRDDPEGVEAYGWYTDQYTWVVASLRLKLRHSRHPLAVNHWGDENEAWHKVAPDAALPPLAVLHFCQDIKLSEAEWFMRHEHRPQLTPKLFDCGLEEHEWRLPGPETLTNASLYEAQLQSRQTLHIPPEEWAEREGVYQLRRYWVYRTLIPLINEAFEDYRLENC